MKKKIYKIMGVALVVVLLASLTVGLAVPAGADPGKLKFTKLTLPKVEDQDGSHPEFVASEGDFWAAPLTDVGPIAVSPDGDTIFAAVSPGAYRPIGGPANWYDVLKSTDGGYSWVATGFYEEWNDMSDGYSIVDIVVSPDYDEDSTVIVATEWSVYQSVDSGKNFVCMEDTPPWWVTDGDMIRDIDVALDERGRLAYVVGSWDRWSGGSGEVYVLSTATGLSWEDQGVSDNLAGTNDNDVLAVAFWPGTDAEGIVAVTTDYDDDDGTGPDMVMTMVRFSYGYIGEDDPDLGWGADIVDAYIKDATGFNFDSIHARIAFPNDFDAWGVGTNVFFAGIYSMDGFSDLYFNTYDAANVKGDVYKIVCKEAGTSGAIDLDIRGVVTTLLPTATDIVSIDVCGDAEDANIVVGVDYCDLTATPSQWLVYHSEDGGESWMFSFKAPTGGMSQGDLVYERANTYVVMAPDYCAGSTAYASTWGLFTSAFHRTTDGANSWNQISIIDYGDYGDPSDGYYVTGYGLHPFGYTTDGTIRMITSISDPLANPNAPPYTQLFLSAVWERTDGKHWERIFSYATPSVTNDLFQLSMPMDGSAIFAVDFMEGAMWRSTDGGATWPKKITLKPDVQWVTPVSATTIYTGHGDGTDTGGIWWSTKSGTGWTKPDDTEIGNDAIVVSVSVAGDVVLASTFGGEVFISSDGGETVENVGKTDPGVASPAGTLATFDLGFAANNIIYATSLFTGNGVWRCEVDLDDPGAGEWEQIDNIQDDDPYDYDDVVTSSPAITLPLNGILYVVDGAAVVKPDVDGGLWRCTNPTADVDGPVPPYFEKENKNLDDDDELFILNADLAPPTFAPTFFCYNMAFDDYWEQVVMFTDTLNMGVPLAMPAEDATGVGLLPAGYVKPEVTLAWESMAGATSYQYQVAIDADFKTRIPPGCGYTDSLAVGDIELNPNMTYYWRVRVADDGSLIGAPLISPWSATWKFKTAIGATMARPDLEAPWSGEPDVPLDPTFEWSGIEWAEVYEFELATDPGTTAGGYFSAPLKALIGTEALVSTAWKCDIALDYDSRYYWHVKAFGVDTETPWSDVGTFTTMSKAVPAPEPVPPIVVPPAEQITPAWIWAIVIIGAILVIAVVVLIVTTRRVP